MIKSRKTERRVVIGGWFRVGPSVADHQPKDSQGLEQVRSIFCKFPRAKKAGDCPFGGAAALLPIDRLYGNACQRLGSAPSRSSSRSGTTLPLTGDKAPESADTIALTPHMSLGNRQLQLVMQRSLRVDRGHTSSLLLYRNPYSPLGLRPG